MKAQQFASEGPNYWQVTRDPHTWFSVSRLDDGSYAITSGTSGRGIKVDGAIGRRILRAVAECGKK